MSSLSRFFPPRPSDDRTAWLWTAGLFAAAFLTRLSLEPVLGGALAYSSFYPVIIVVSYAFGRRQAVAAALLAAPLAFWCFVEPAFGWKSGANVLTALAVFGLNSAAAILVITGLTGALRELAGQLGRAQAVADSHADLFRELNERMSLHMRLVSGVLALQAKGEPEAEVADGLKRAAERTLLISRVHRELGGHGDEPVEFGPFATALARAVCLAKNTPPERAEVAPSDLKLTAEEATSMGVALAECLSALIDAKAPGAVRIRLAADATRTEVAIADAGHGAKPALVSVTKGYLLRAMAEQLGAAVSLRADAEGSAIVLTMSRSGQAPAVDSGAGASTTVH